MTPMIVFIGTSVVTFFILYKLWGIIVNVAIEHGYIDSVKKLHIEQNDNDAKKITKSALSTGIYFIFMVIGRMILFIIGGISVFFGLFMKDLLK